MKNFKVIFVISVILSVFFLASCSQVEEKSSVSLKIPANELVARGVVSSDDVCDLTLSMYYEDWEENLAPNGQGAHDFEKDMQKIEAKGTCAQLAAKTHTFSDLEAGKKVRVICDIYADLPDDSHVYGWGESEILTLAEGKNSIKITLEVYQTPPVEKITLLFANTTGLFETANKMYIGESANIGIAFSPEGAYTNNVTWKFDKEVLKANYENGYLLSFVAIKEGKTTITAKTKGGKEAHIEIEVETPTDATLTREILQNIEPNYETMKDYTIPDWVKIIDGSSSYTNGLFYGHKNIESIIIPATVQEIKQGAFYDCEKLSTVIIKAETRPTLGSTDVFKGTAENLIIYVPKGKKDAYIDSSSTIWPQLSDKIQELDE